MNKINKYFCLFVIGKDHSTKLNDLNLKNCTFSQKVSGFLFIYFLMLFSSCTEKSCDQTEEYEHIDLNITTERLEGELQKFTSPQDAYDFLKSNRTLADFFLDARQYPDDSILASRMHRLFSHESIDSLFLEVDDYYKNWEEIEQEFERAYQFLKFQYPESKVPRVQTMVTGLYNDMYVSDSLIVVGLDFFMGVKGSFHSNEVPLYIVRRYMKESIVPFVLTLTSVDYNKVSNENTLLADMINLGKSYYFVSQALPCKPDSLIIGYTAEEIQLVKENQEVIWANLIENELLYETDRFIINKFTGESPNVVEISEKCPGRVGAWVGWEIVRNYMEENPEVSFVELMNETDAHKIFQKSGYKPRNQF